MNNFYFTFGFNNMELRNRFLKIKADDMEQACEIVFKSRVGRRFAFVYEEDEFMPQIVRYNLKEILLGEINVY